jgi:hypothetical protein
LSNGGEQQKHEPGTRVETAGDYVPIDGKGDRTAGPVPLAEGDDFPPLNGPDEAWVAAGTGGEDG